MLEYEDAIDFFRAAQVLGNIQWRHRRGCLQGRLHAVVAQVPDHDAPFPFVASVMHLDQILRLFAFGHDAIYAHYSMLSNRFLDFGYRFSYWVIWGNRIIVHGFMA
jgi:hypothetical protein